MTEYSYLDYTADAESNQEAGSPLLTRFPEQWAGSRVNGSLAALASALRNLGDSSAKLPLDENGDPDPGPNGGRIGTMAWQNADSVDIAGGILGVNVRGSMPVGSLIPWHGTYAQLVAVYHVDLKLRGWVIADGRTEVNPYPPGNSVTVPNLLGRYAYFYDDASTLGTGQFAHTKTTSSDGSHAHTGATGGVSLVGSQLPTLARTKAVQGGSGAGVVDEYSGAGTAHAHAIGTDGAHAHTVDVRPASIVCVPLLRVW